ncbi:outer membrane beta-barrel protein [Gemmatimonas sp.]|uniref:outer membrane beta-barrel protein n=1 Tax=Gemmatimonas sp. TaxID=1962908 RepID=UPI003983BEF6
MNPVLQPTSRVTYRVALATTAAVALVASIAVAPATSAQGVRFTLSPSAEYTWWDKSLGIEDAPFYGGRFGADFGSLLSVSGYYHRATALGVTRDSLRSAGVRQLGPRRTTTDASTFGGNLAIRLSTGRIAPFLSAGAGVMRFEADSVERQDQINYRYGGGIQYDATPNIRAMVMLEDSRFRLAPGTLFTSTTGGNSLAERRVTRSNWTASAGLGIAIGGALDEETRDNERTDRWSIGSVPLEAFAGRLDFDDKSLPRQALVGVRTGIDVGQFVGLRAFYWQGRSGNLRDKQPMESYGGEAQFNFTRSRGPSPFIVLGAGRLDFGEDYRDTQGRARDAETALIAGAGVAFRLTDNFRLNVAVRDYVRGPQDLDSIATTDQLTNNLMYTVGLGFDLGRSRKSMPSRDERDARAERERMARDRDDRMMTRDPDLLRMRREMAARDTMMEARDSMMVMMERRVGRENPRRRGQPVQPARPIMIMLPAPTVGELYIRYGDSTQRTMRVTPADVQRLSDSTAARQANDSLVRELRAQIERLEARLRTPDAASRDNVKDEEVRALRARLDALDMQLRMTPSRVVPPNVAPTMVMTPPNVVVMPSSSTATGTSALRIQQVSPYVAGFGQLALGAQLDLGPVFGVTALRLVPDFAIGLGNGTSVSLAVGAQYDFGALRLNTPGTYRPYLRAGLGFLAASGDRDSEFGVNAAYGVTYDRVATSAGTDADRRRPQYFVEHQGINFFSTNRFLVGMRFSTK